MNIIFWELNKFQKIKPYPKIFVEDPYFTLKNNYKLITVIVPETTEMTISETDKDTMNRFRTDCNDLYWQTLKITRRFPSNEVSTIDE